MYPGAGTFVLIRPAQTFYERIKLAGLQSPRGWGLFLIKEMVDEFHVTSDGEYHTIELVMNLKGGPTGDE